jgi:hypothetical protein
MQITSDQFIRAAFNHVDQDQEDTTSSVGDYADTELWDEETEADDGADAISSEK